MTKATGLFGAAFLLLCVASAQGQSGQRKSEIGYLYPAGAQQGSVVRVLVGGQNLRGLKGVHVTGEGVTAEVVRYNGRFVRLNGEERRIVRDQLRERMLALGAEGPGEEQNELYRRLKERGEREKRAAAARKKAEEAKKRAEAKKAEGDAAKKDGAPGKDGDVKPGQKKRNEPDLRKITRHPLLSILDRLPLEELEFVARKFLRTDRRLQPNAQINETAMIEVTVFPTAEPGNRELRLLTPLGLTNPMCFQVGNLPEVREPKPSDVRPADSAPIALPVVLNGQITPGDVDRFSVRAEAGQKLVIRVHARRLVPFLADAVPGWFQAVLTLRDEKGMEVAYADDFRFDPDPVLYFEIPETGTYKVEIRDSIYRGRDDFVYRIQLSEQPFVKSVFPLGGRRGEEAAVSLDGWNLDETKLALDTRPDAKRIRTASLNLDGGVSNEVAYAVDDLPEAAEAEPNDAVEKAQAVDLPTIVNGRIGKSGDVDRFRFEGKAGDRFVADVTARRLHSPLDSLLRLREASGKVVAWNDDTVYKQGHLHKEMGVLTHHSDSYLSATLPADGS